MKKRTKQDKTKFIARVVSLILAGLMVAGAAYYAIYLMTLNI